MHEAFQQGDGCNRPRRRQRHGADVSRRLILCATLCLHGLIGLVLVGMFQVVFSPAPRSLPPRVALFEIAPPAVERDGERRRPEPAMPTARQHEKTPRPLAMAQLSPKEAPAVFSGAADGLERAAAPTMDAEQYRQSLHDRIALARRYPQDGIRARMEGTALVAFLLHRDGSISGLDIARSSGRGLLDDAARDAVRRSEPFPAIPQNLPDSLDVTVPVVFALDRGPGPAMALVP